MSPDDLERKLVERPFQPFRIKLSNSSTIDVHFPGDIVMGRSSATFPMDVVPDAEGFRVVRSWRTVALAHMAEFTDIAAIRNGGKKKRR